MAGRWNPWRALRSRDHLTLDVRPLPPGVRGTYSPGTVTLSPSLGRRQRRATLAHELVHDERRVLPPATEATMQREEAIVRATTARRLVPLDELGALADGLGEIGPVMAWEVADHFDVPEHVAWEAVRQLQADALTAELGRALDAMEQDGGHGDR